jgi:hypothetical protein
LILSLSRRFHADYPEAPYLPDQYAAHRASLKILRKQAEEMAHLRIVREAEMIEKNNCITCIKNQKCGGWGMNPSGFRQQDCWGR